MNEKDEIEEESKRSYLVKSVEWESILETHIEAKWFCVKGIVYHRT